MPAPGTMATGAIGNLNAANEVVVSGLEAEAGKE